MLCAVLQRIFAQTAIFFAEGYIKGVERLHWI